VTLMNPDEVRLSVLPGSVVTVVTFLLVAMLAGYRVIGWPPVVIVGGSGVAAFVLWNLTYLRHPLMPEIVLPPFLLSTHSEARNSGSQRSGNLKPTSTMRPLIRSNPQA
jgi:hypothetical protein